MGYYQQEGDYDFHTKLSKAAVTSMLAKLLTEELYQLVRMYRIQYSTTPNRPQQVFKEHHSILDAIAAGDGELANFDASSYRCITTQY